MGFFLGQFFWGGGLWNTEVKTKCIFLSLICVFGSFLDPTDSSSFQRARFWVKELQNCEEVCQLFGGWCARTVFDRFFFNRLQHCKIYLCGTKSDLIQGDRSLRQIDYHDTQDFAEGDDWSHPRRFCWQKGWNYFFKNDFRLGKSNRTSRQMPPIAKRFLRWHFLNDSFCFFALCRDRRAAFWDLQ